MLFDVLQQIKFWVTKQQVNQLCMLLYEKMRFEDYKPDVIVCVMQGGFVPSMKLSRLFDCPVIQLRARKYNVRGDTLFRMTKIEKIKELGAVKVLIVDDVVETGNTMEEVTREVSKFTKTIKTACLFENLDLHPRYRSNFVGSIKANESWSMFYWEQI